MPRSPNLRPNVFYDCELCGKHVERYMTPYDQKQYPPRYCSRKCAGIARRGPGHPLWQGGRKVAADDGYVSLWRPEHPGAVKGYVLEHRLVMEEFLGRYLTPAEVVHHVNEDTGDNRIENLILFPDQRAHKRHEDADRPRDHAGRLLPKVVA